MEMINVFPFLHNYCEFRIIYFAKLLINSLSQMNETHFHRNKIRNETNSEDRHLVFSITNEKKSRDILSLFQTYCQAHELNYGQAVAYTIHICKVGYGS